MSSWHGCWSSSRENDLRVQGRPYNALQNLALITCLCPIQYGMGFKKMCISRGKITGVPLEAAITHCSSFLILNPIWICNYRFCTLRKYNLNVFDFNREPMSGKHQKLVEYRVNRLGDSRIGFRIRVAAGIWVTERNPEKSKYGTKHISGQLLPLVKRICGVR